MIKKEGIIVIFFLLNFIFSFSQEFKDTLQLNSSVEKVNLLLKEAENKSSYLTKILESKVLEIINNERQDTTKGKLFISLAYHFYKTKKDTLGKNYLKKAERLLERKNENLYLKTLIGLSRFYTLLHKTDSAFYYKKKSLQKSIELNDSISTAKSYFNLGMSYYYNNEGLNYTKAHKYFAKAITYYNGLNIEDADFYQMYAVTSKKREEAEKYFKKSENLLINDKRKKVKLYLRKGNYYFDEKLFNKSFESFKKANEEAVKINSRELFPIYTGMGGAKLRLKHYNEAITYLKVALKNKNAIGYGNKISILKDLAEAYEKTGNYKKALEFTQQKIELKDSFNSKQNEKKLLEFDIRYQSAEKDKQIAGQKLQLLQQKNKQNYWFIISLAVLSIITLIYQRVSNKQKRKKLKAENDLVKAKEIERVRTEFIGNISHEVRTPLTLILGNIQMALEEGIKNKKIENYLNMALNSSKKAIEDFNQILELLKFQKHKQILKKSVINIHSFCKQKFLSFESLAISKSIKLNFFSNIPKDVLVESDPDKLEKIINNFVSNAIKYSNSDSKINFFLSFKNNRFYIEVQDYGLGIPKKDEAKIFERFYQAENSKEIGGIGVGLALSKYFAELLGGSISVKSQLGKGSSFILEIPFNRINKNEVGKKYTKIGTLQKQENKFLKEKVLIVEDNIEMGIFLKEILSKNYNCTIAFDGKEALEILKKELFDLITSDIMMPKMDGFEFREKLNKLDHYKQIPFMFISAKSLEQDVVKGFDLGVQDYVIKPFNKNELLARVKNLILNKKTREVWSLKNKESLQEEKESFNKELIKKAEEIVIKNISNENFKVADLASEVGYSQRQFTRLLKEFTGLSPVKFILEIRLQKAYWLLENKIYPTLSEVKYEVGITSTTYFNKKFKERFGFLHKS